MKKYLWIGIPSLLILSGCVATLPGVIPTPFNGVALGGTPLATSTGGSDCGAANGNAGRVEISAIGTKTYTARQLFDSGNLFTTMDMFSKISAECPELSTGGLALFSAILSGDIKGASKEVANFVLDKLIESISYSALNQAVQSMTNNPKLLDEVKVEVPQVVHLVALGGLKAHDEIMGIARFLAAMKVSNRIIEEGYKKLEDAKILYKKTLYEQETYAKTLGASAMLLNGVFKLDEKQLQSRELAFQGNGNLSYLKKQYGKPLDEVLKDPIARGLIDSELRARFPEKYLAVSQAERKVVSHYSAYANATTGTLSMLGFSALFLKRAEKIAKRSPLHTVAVLPFAGDAMGEVFAMGKNVIGIYSKSDELIEGTFTYSSKGKTIRGLTASNVFSKLSSAELEVLGERLIGDRNALLIRLDGRCAEFSSDIMDRLVDRESKQNLAKNIYESGSALEEFSFKSSFAPSTSKVGGKTLRALDVNVKKRLYSENHVSATSGNELIYGQIQNAVRKNVSKLNNQDLRRFIFLGGENQIRLRGATIRMEQPGIQGLTDQYEMNLKSASCQLIA